MLDSTTLALCKTKDELYGLVANHTSMMDESQIDDVLTDLIWDLKERQTSGVTTISQCYGGNNYMSSLYKVLHDLAGR